MKNWRRGRWVGLSLLGVAGAAMVGGEATFTPRVKPRPQPMTAGKTVGPYRYRDLGAKAARPQDLAAAFAYIVNSEYDVRWRPGPRAYGCANRRQAMHFSFLPNGFTAEPLAGQSGAKPWKMTLRLRAYGRQAPVDSSAPSMAKADEQTLRVTTPEVVYDYTNGPAGMRQNFIIEQKPKGGKLRLELAAELAGLELGVDNKADAAYFTDTRTRHEVMRYCDLHVWDANGRALPARMARLSRRRLAIEVDDRLALYPVVVDPLSSLDAILGPQKGDQFGFSVAAGGSELDADNVWGFLLVGAPNYINENGSQNGAVFVFAGLSTGGFNSTAYWYALGSQAFEKFGYSVAVSVGQAGYTFNGDSEPDLVVGSPYGGFYQSGRVSVWYGTVTAGAAFGANNSAPDWLQDGTGQFGHTVAVAPGIQRAEGPIDSLLVGAPYYDNDPYLEAGAAYAYYGSAPGSPGGLPASPSWSVVASDSYVHLGMGVAGVERLDGNTYADAIIGAPGAYPGGYVYVYSSDGTGLGTSPAQTYPTPESQSDASFGFSVAGIPRFNGNNGAFAVGAPGWPVGGNAGAGQVFVYDTLSNTTPAAQETALKTQAGAEFGYSVAGGDVDGDANTYGDLMVGTPYQDINPIGGGTWTKAGSAYAFYASGSGGFIGEDVYLGDASYAYLGQSVAWIPFAVGAPQNHAMLVGAPGDPGLSGQGSSACYVLYYKAP